MLVSFLRSFLESVVPDHGPQPHLYFLSGKPGSFHACVLADMDGVPIVFNDYGGDATDWVQGNLDKFEIPSDAEMGKSSIGGLALTADALRNPESVPWKEGGWSLICLKKGEMVPERFRFNVAGTIADA